MDDSKEVNDDKGENKKELKEINEKEKEPPIVQWIVLRKDLLDDLHWPRGSVVAQACHSSLAAIWAFKEEESTILYMGDIANMHKVVLETSSEKELQSLSDKLKIAGEYLILISYMEI